MTTLGTILIIAGFLSCILLMLGYVILISTMLTGYSVTEDIKNSYSTAVNKATNKEWSTKR
ncbi:membrane protein [Proteus phage phiP4-3]|uniref:Putative membrane protein n=1 Tax=Proteus phage phiP4-3 TaxID=2065203 RepID=A0A2I6PFL4_9CAUD|nr:membrane protein [Proteus phage phiP4-3]AUM58501.1 putative membrane protein [Proteus phage phiP4-3]AZV01257.1 membrane protein [Shigella phage vB_SdyM_006]